MQYKDHVTVKSGEIAAKNSALVKTKDCFQNQPQIFKQNI